jgi:DNA polymerase III subunit gamma/tau
VVALAAGQKPVLHAHLRYDVHPVRVAPGRLEIRVLPTAPRDLAAQLGALLQERTGTRWTVALSNAEGEPTLAEQGRAAEAGRRSLAEGHPLVQAVLAAFPGTVIEAVRDAAADAYGLVAPAIAEGDEPPDFDDVPPPDDDDRE